jgi:hypothetical protein
MSLFERRKGGSIFESFNKTGIKKIIKMIKIGKNNNRYKNSDRFKPVVESSPSLGGTQERESNKMFVRFYILDDSMNKMDGTFDLERAV